VRTIVSNSSFFKSLVWVQIHSASWRILNELKIWMNLIREKENFNGMEGFHEVVRPKGLTLRPKEIPLRPKEMTLRSKGLTLRCSAHVTSDGLSSTAITLTKAPMKA